MFNFETSREKYLKDGKNKTPAEVALARYSKATGANAEKPKPQERDFFDIYPEDLYAALIKETLEKELDLSAKNGFGYNYRLLSHYEQYLLFKDEFYETKEDKMILADLKKSLRKKLNIDTNSYFLNEYLKAILNKTVDLNKFNQWTKPFLIQPDKYAIIKGDTIYLTDKSKEEIDNLINERNTNYQNTKLDLELIKSFNLKLGKEDFLLGNQSHSDDFNNQLNIYSDLLYTELYKDFEKDFGIKIVDLSIKEQFQFITYLQDINYKKAKDIKDFTNKFGSVAFKTFLSIEHGGKEMGDKVITLSKKLPEDIAKKVFTKYSELISSLDQELTSIKDKLKTEKTITKEDELAVRDNFLNRAKNVLLKAFDNLDNDPLKLIEDLDKINSDNLSILSIFQSLKNTQNLKFEDLKDFQFYLTYSSTEFITFEELSEMENIIDKNYQTNPEILKIIKNSLTNRVLNGYNWVDVPILKYKGKIVAFCALDFGFYKDTPDFSKKVYFNSFNVDPDFANGEIGQAMLDRVLNQTSLKQIIEADCNAVSKIGAHYIEFGFFAKDFYDFHGWPSFKIERNNKLIPDLIGKNLSNQDIIDNSDLGFIEKNNKKAFLFKEKKQEDFIKYF